VSAVPRRRAATVWLLTLALAGVTALTGCGGAATSGAAPAAAAGATPSAGGGAASSIGVAATSSPGPDAYESSGRTGDVHLVLPPAGTREPYPLVIALHSLYHSGDEATTWGLAQLAAKDGFAMVSPSGLDGSWNAGSCCGPSGDRHLDDVGWLHALIEHLESDYPIDPDRVVIVGLSNGGMLAYRYACERPEDIAGIAVVAGSLQTLGCHPSVPLTVVSVHGGRDRTVPDAGTFWQPALQTAITSTNDSLAPFRAVDRCAPVTAASTAPTGADGAPRISDTASTGSAATTPAQLRARGPALTLAPVDPVASPPDALRTETTCAADGTRVVQYFLPQADHGWPPTTGSAAFDTAEVVWSLLSSARAHTPNAN
jgi:poly(3-hydroxybutyrate) depolymerase